MFQNTRNKSVRVWATNVAKVWRTKQKNGTWIKQRKFRTVLLKNSFYFKTAGGEDETSILNRNDFLFILFF